jgi:signal transduction histidine kinase
MSAQHVPELCPELVSGRNRGDRRFVVNQAARLTVPGTTGPVWEARIRDISRHGMQLVAGRKMPGPQIRIEWNGREICATIRYQERAQEGWRLGVELASSWDSLVSDVLAHQARELESANRALDRALEKAHEANAVKSRFLASVSHELRTPLNGIIGFTQLLHDGKMGAVNEGQRDCLSEVLTCSDHLLTVIGQLLDLAKIESGRMEFRYETVSIPRLVSETIDSLRPLAAAKSIAIERRLDSRMDTVEADPARLKQVLYNYLSNALKFTPEGGVIVISVTAEGRARYRIVVADSGPGIEPEELPRLFQEFEQLEAGRKSLSGSGLGLAITKRIVETQGGRVGVESTPGKGSRFYAVLPVRPERC